MKAKMLVGAATGVAISIAAPLIEMVEGVEYKPYIDIAGIPTTCAGITGPDVDMKKIYTKSECRKLLEKHIAIHARYVDKAVKHPITPETRAALISFSYNVGGRAMTNSTTIRLINQGRVEQGCRALGMWNKARVNGKLKVVKGLVNRRNVEIEQCLKGIK